MCKIGILKSTGERKSQILLIFSPVLSCGLIGRLEGKRGKRKSHMDTYTLDQCILIPRKISQDSIPACLHHLRTQHSLHIHKIQKHHPPIPTNSNPKPTTPSPSAIHLISSHLTTSHPFSHPRSTSSIQPKPLPSFLIQLQRTHHPLKSPINEPEKAIQGRNQRER